MHLSTVSYDKMMIRKVVRRIPSEGNKKILWKILFFLGLFIVSFLIFFTYRIYSSSDQIVENHLKSQRWALPSTIYADAPILYQGMPMQPDRLEDYLVRLNYQKNGAPQVGIGEYHRSKNQVLFRKHSLFDTGKAEPVISVRFSTSALERIDNLDTNTELPAYELEPIAISNLFGAEWEKRTLIKYDDLPE